MNRRSLIFFLWMSSLFAIVSAKVDICFRRQWHAMQRHYGDLCQNLSDQGYSNLEATYCHPYWFSVKNKTHDLILGAPDKRFLINSCISGQMVRGTMEPGVVSFETNYLQQVVDDYTKQLIAQYKEPSIGWLPKECKEFDCSHNALGQLYYAGVVLENCGGLNTIIEFGSGYGCLAAMFKRMIPSVTLILIDLPELLALQYLYLTVALPKVKVMVHKEVPHDFEQGAIHLVPSLYLKDLSMRADLFISAFAISETPRLVQDIVIKKQFFNAKYCYIIGQLYSASNDLFEDHNSLYNAIKTSYDCSIDQPFHIVRAQSYELFGRIKRLPHKLTDKQPFLTVDFYDSMCSWGTYKKDAGMQDVNTCLVKEYYEKFVLHDCMMSEAPRIPKIIHQIWLGSPFPEAFKAYQQSWIQMHPDWQYILWTEKEIEAFGLVNKQLYDSVKNYAVKSDIARYEILDRMGGLYIDTDFECLKSFNMLNHCFDFYTGCVDSSTMILLNGLLASRPGHSILKHCIDAIHNVPSCDSADPVKIMDCTGPYQFTRSYLASLSEDVGRCVVFPLTYFYPFPAHLRKISTDSQKVKNKWVQDESFAIHWWKCSWQKNN